MFTFDFLSSVCNSHPLLCFDRRVTLCSHHAWTHPPRAGDSPLLARTREEIYKHVLFWLAEDE
jgi:hypothetical protein